MSKKYILCIIILCLYHVAPSYKLNQTNKYRYKRLSERMTTRRRYVCRFITFSVHTSDRPSGVNYRTNDIADLIDKRKMTKVLIHGWRGDEDSDMPLALRLAYINLNYDVNVVVVGWGKYALLSDYVTVVKVRLKVSNCIARFLVRNLLHESPLMNLHIIGHSIGAHIAGQVGQVLRYYGLLVKRITGLDPAGPMITRGLSSAEASFVDVIHTTAGTLGQIDPVGHVDFYPNGGTAPQPQCQVFEIGCSHSRAWQYFRDSIMSQAAYPAQKCSSYFRFLISYCSETAFMGEGTLSTTRGVFYLNTDK